MSAVTPQEQILGIVNNHWQSCCVGAAAQLELADVLADGPLHVDLHCRAHQDARAEPVSAAAGSREHGDLHSNLASSIRQHAGERLPPPQSAGLQLGLDSLHALLGRAGIRGVARVDAVLEERPPRLRSGDRPERLGAHAIEPGDGHDLQSGDAGPEHLDQSGRGRRVRLEPIPCDRGYRRRNRLAIIEHSRRASVLPRNSVRSAAGRRGGAGRQPNRACRRRLLQRYSHPSRRLRHALAAARLVGRGIHCHL